MASKPPVKPRVRGVRVSRLSSVLEPRGRLVVVQPGVSLPFTPQRCFMIMDVPNKGVRGEHAHIRQKQFLVCVRGRVTVLVDDGRRREEHLLDDPAVGLLVPPMVWAAQYNYSKDAVLILFASAKYDPRDYIRDYKDFRKRVKQ